MVNQKINLFLILFFLVACNGNYSGNEKDFSNSLNIKAKSFVAVGDAGSIITSDDGILWDSITSRTKVNLNRITLGGSIHIVGNVGIIMSLMNNKLWSKHFFNRSNNTSIVYGNGRYFIVSTDGELFLTSDWYNWTPVGCGNDAFYDVAYDNVSNYILAVGANGLISKTEDMKSCTQKVSNTSNNLNGVNFLNNKYVVVGNSGTILTSSDGGNTWNTKTSGTLQDLMAIIYENNTYVVVGRSGTILISSDGETWLSKNSGTLKDLYGITYGKNKFVAVGMEGTILTSIDLESWDKRSSVIIVSINDVIYKNN